jgi:hypothetical protein
MIVFNCVVKVLKWVLLSFILEFWKYTVLSQFQTDTAAKPVNELFYSTHFGESHVTNSSDETA